MDNCDLIEEAAERGLNGVIYSSMKQTGNRMTGKPKQVTHKARFQPQ